MALSGKKVILKSYTPLVQAQRFRGKINIQKPREPHYERKKFLEVLKPYYPKRSDLVPCTKGVNFWKKEEIDNPFQRILSKECLNWFNNSRLIAIYHKNPFLAEDKYKAQVQFYRKQMYLKEYGKETLKMAIEGTKFESILPYYMAHNMIVFSREPNVKDLLKINKKFPQITLLFGIFEDRFLSKDELTEYSLIPNLQAAQASLVQTLQAAGSQLVSNLNAHQNTLVNQLQERVKQLELSSDTKVDPE